MDLGLTVPINVSWSLHSLLLHDINQRVSTAVNQNVNWAGTHGLTHKDLHWCVCLLHIQLQKDLRVGNPGVDFKTDPVEQKEKLVECAKTAIACRPDLPRGYSVITQVYQDLLHVGDPADRVLAYQYAKEGLQVAEAYGDPFYLYELHTVVAYWKISDVNEEPYTLREIKEHLIKADEYKRQCRSYFADVDFHRGKQTKMHIEKSLKRAQEHVDVDQVLTMPLTGMPEDGHDDLTAKERALANQFHCGSCGRVITHMRSCGRCQKVAYCDEVCQKQHWRNGHKQQCTAPRKESSKRKGKSR
jgi:hypothetical protein